MARSPQAAIRVESVERALLVLQCFHQPGEALSLAVLAQRSRLYKSTILRLAGSLLRFGFLHRDEAGQYLLGPELQRLGALSRARPDLSVIIRPVLAYLVAQTQETASFYVRDGDARVCLLRQNSPRLARHHLEEGGRHPLDRGAAGAVLRAYSDDAGRRAAAVRRQGWAVSLGDREPDLAAVAVPLLNADGHLVGALTVSGLISRFPPDKLAQYRALLTEQAALLRPRLGGGVQPPS